MGKAINKAKEIIDGIVDETLTPENQEGTAEATPQEEPQAPAVTLEELESIDMEAFAYEEEPEGPRMWRITDDSCADWAVQKIAEERAELSRIKALAEDQINRIEAKVAAAEKRYENGTAFLQSKLLEYFETVPHKTTKTKHSYRLLSGTLVKKIGGTTMQKDDAKLIQFLKDSGNTDYIKFKEEPKWGEYKKNLEIIGGAIVDKNTGEIVEGVEIETKPDIFTVEV